VSATAGLRASTKRALTTPVGPEGAALCAGAEHSVRLGFWVRASEIANNLDRHLLDALREWVKTAWAFEPHADQPAGHPTGGPAAGRAPRTGLVAHAPGRSGMLDIRRADGASVAGSMNRSRL
jgi:hypothetical protein